MGTLDDNARIRELNAEIERLRAEWRKADDGWIAAKAESGALRVLDREIRRLLRNAVSEDTEAPNLTTVALAARVASLLTRERGRAQELQAEVRELRASGLSGRERSEYERMKRHFDDGSDGGPFSRHRDSMG